MESITLDIQPIAYRGLGPLFLLVGLSLFVLLLEAFVATSRRWIGALTAVGLVAGLAMTVGCLRDMPTDPFAHLFVADSFAYLFDVVFFVAALAAVGLSCRWHRDVDRAEYYALILMATAGMVIMAHAANLVSLFIGLELLSIVLYALTGFLHERPSSAEAALKYFFLGAFASGFVVYGSALVYGVTGSLDFASIAAANGAMAAGGAPMLVVVAAVLVMVGLCFKISSVPFHMWTPDVYEGAPTPIAAFMSVGTKAAAFAAMIRVFVTAFAPLATEWVPLVAGVAVATMLVGNLVALSQLRLKRMLAFSSVAHAGYGLLGLVAWDHGGGAATVFYLVAYAAMNLGAFGVVSALERNGESMYVRDLNGLAERRPFASAAMALFLLSLAGVPPTAGFVGKFYLFMAAVDAGWFKLGVVAVLYSAVAAYFYLRVIVAMYMRPEPAAEQSPSTIGVAAGLVIAGAAVMVVVLGIAPGTLFRIVELAVATLI